MARGQTTEITVLLLLFGLLFLSATRASLAQQQQSNGSSTSTSTSPSHGGRTAGGFTPTTVVVLVVLISAFVLLTLFSIYINRCAAHRPRRAFAAPRPRVAAAASFDAATQYSAGRPRGLDRELVEAFPTAVYGDVKSRMATNKSGPLECAVCLAEFDDADELRILPACCHVFHPGCIDPWLAAAVTCPLCRADLTVTDPPAADLTTDPEIPMVQEEEEECAAAPSPVSSSFMPESETCYSTTWRHEFTGAEGAECCYRYRRTLSAMDAAPDRHTLRLPDHVMKELAAVRRHRRAASLAEYTNAAAAERTTPGWLASFLRSMSRQRQQSRADSGSDYAAGEEQQQQQHGGSKQIYPVAGEKPGGSGSGGGDEKKCSDVDALNRV
ncbi:E3 ubiquitin-protein ligase Os03g0188200 [Brachypodium distachyon]|uniref:RING-type E3 ubiquitin transferase n=1 Tax=Brachypodium distachyon TaxID=15368 RepID=I1H8T1_BRADI|nr:E3 ubiquitin-protein ligase Os03g0188200 [Brachypodium distachyon]KQK23214.1 hypothetical protein BRADI_1g72000v3 [Brachypodium distachyon]|eukprot:XP_003561964.1 E3 ubiquitin-protein ligase Os03g0188200 [Brachypodium distachyon]